jgi:hypothetical protein
VTCESRQTQFQLVVENFSQTPRSRVAQHRIGIIVTTTVFYGSWLSAFYDIPGDFGGKTAPNNHHAMEDDEPTLRGILITLKRIESLLESQQRPPDHLEQEPARRGPQLSAMDQNPNSNESSTPINIAPEGLMDRGELIKEELNEFPKCNVADMPEFDRYIGKGNMIPPDGILPLQFSQGFLQTIGLDEARRKLQVLGEYKKEVRDNDVKFRIIDVDHGEVNSRRELLCKWLNETILCRLGEPTDPLGDNNAEGKQCRIKYFRSMDEDVTNSVGPVGSKWGRVMYVVQPLSHSPS